MIHWLLVGLITTNLALASVNSISPNKIVGENDLIAVNSDGSNLPPEISPFIDAVGLLSLGCTATHIGEGVVITAGHCLRAAKQLLGDLDCASINVVWGYRKDSQPYLISKCVKVLFFQNDRFSTDFAILKVTPVPRAKIPVELERTPQANDLFTILSHPEEKGLMWSKSCLFEDKHDPMFDNQFMHHYCDTNPGSSGAAIIDANALKIVAIHVGGQTKKMTESTNFATLLTNATVKASLRALGF